MEEDDSMYHISDSPVQTRNKLHARLCVSLFHNTSREADIRHMVTVVMDQLGSAKSLWIKPIRRSGNIFVILKEF
jgi:hypothetical protein